MTYVSFIQRKEKSASRSTVRQAPYYMELPVTQNDGAANDPCYRTYFPILS